MMKLTPRHRRVAHARGLIQTITLTLIVGLTTATARADLLPNGLPDPRLLHVNVDSTAPAISLASLNFDLLRATYGVDGSGIKVGVISDSYNTTGAPLVLPANVNIVKDDLDTDYGGLGSVSPTDSGRAMVEVLNAIAPGAQYYFHSAFNNDFTSANVNKKVSTPTSMTAAVDALVAQGVDIIVDSTGYLNEPWFQDGGNPAVKRTVSQAVNDAKAAGVSYFAAAGNSNAQSYEAPYWDSGLGFGNNMFHRFGNAGGVVDQITLDVDVPAGATVRVALQWNDPFESLGEGSVNGDFSIFLFNTGQVTDPTSTRDQFANGDSDGDGQPDLDAWEIVSWTNNSGSAKTIGVGLGHVVTSVGQHDLKLIVEGQGVTIDPADVDGQTLGKWTVAGHPSALGAITIGSFGGGSAVDSDSGLAGAVIRFDDDGNPINEPRNTPALNPMLTGLDDFDLSASGIPGLATFDGTGAAASYVSGIAALLLEAGVNAGMNVTPDDLYQMLKATADDIETVGFDNLSGHGLVNPGGALDQIGIPEPGTLALIGLAGLAITGRARAKRS